MTDEQHRKLVKRRIKEYTKENCKTPELARAALIKSGIYTKAGKLKKEYGG